MESSAGWSTHLIVLGALGAVGVVLTVFDYAGSPSGGPISLRGLVSLLYWMGFAAFAVASTATFALLRARLGAPLSYAAAVPLAVAFAWLIWFGWRAIGQQLDRKSNESMARDLTSRMTLESWSMVEEAGGVLRFTAAVRADRDGSIEFEPLAAIGGSVAVDGATRSAERALRAGERAVLEATAKRKAQGTFDSFDLYFISRVDRGETGQIAYSTDAKEEGMAYGLLKRPLPPPSAVTR